MLFFIECFQKGPCRHQEQGDPGAGRSRSRAIQEQGDPGALWSKSWPGDPGAGQVIHEQGNPGAGQVIQEQGNPGAGPLIQELSMERKTHEPIFKLYLLLSGVCSYQVDYICV